MNKNQQQLYLSFFQQLHQTQQILDKLKIDLALIDGYNPNLLFNLISERQQQITIEQMRFYLSTKMSCNHRQLYQIFEKFDWGRNGKINRSDFVRELVPFGKRPNQHQHYQGLVDTRIEGAFIAIFIEIVKRFRIIQVSRKQIVFIQPYHAFEHLDIWKKGIIGLGQLEFFYKQNNFEIGQRQLYFLLHALRRRCYRDVNLEVFCENLNPLEFGQYTRFGMEMENQVRRQVLQRSRRQQEIIHKSIVDAQKLQHQVHRMERRKQAQIQRQLSLEEKINLQILDHDRNQQLNARRSLLLEDQKSIRNRIIVDNQLKRIQQTRRFAQLEALHERQSLLKQRALQNEIQLQASRRQKLYEKQTALQMQIGRQLNSYRTGSKIRDLQRSRRQIQLQSIREKQLALRQLDPSKYRIGHLQSSTVSRSIKQSQILELQKQLQKTRAQIKQRRNRLQIQEHLRKQNSSTKNSNIAQSPY